MCHADNEKGKKRNSGKNRAAKSEKHQNAWKEVKLHILGNIESSHHSIEMKENIRVLQSNKKIFSKSRFVEEISPKE